MLIEINNNIHHSLIFILNIGNIKLGPINFIHKTGEISYFIGEKELWGKGYTTLAIKEIIKIAKKMGLKKLKAGLYEMNIGSKKVLSLKKVFVFFALSFLDEDQKLFFFPF